MKIYNNNYSPSFKSVYTVDTSSAYSRQQVLTLGMLMSNFWVYQPRPTFNKMKYSGVYGPVEIQVKDYRDNIVETILKNNQISYKKKDQTSFSSNKLFINA